MNVDPRQYDTIVKSVTGGTMALNGAIVGSLLVTGSPTVTVGPGAFPIAVDEQTNTVYVGTLAGFGANSP